jgi:hypothetical protein
MVITKDDFTDWRSNPVTKAFYSACIDRVEDAKDVLGSTAGVDPDQDNFYRGFIHAYREMFDFRVEEIEGDEVEDKE